MKNCYLLMVIRNRAKLLFALFPIGIGIGIVCMLR